MKLFFRVMVAYLVISMTLTMFLHDVSVDLAEDALAASLVFAFSLARASVWVVALVLSMPLIMGWRGFTENLANLGFALAGSILLQIGFSFLKTSIPLMVPFYADPLLASFDKWIHGGTDPWILAHHAARWIPVEALLPAYIALWGIPAMAMALIIVVTDRDPARAGRFLVLYVACWVVLGNVLATVFASVGPVFYDGVEGGTRFAALHEALDRAGVTASHVGVVQAYLWDGYAKSGISLGSGISAFPSVHVGIATITALYLGERSRWLLLPGLGFLSIILFLSVYTGYHYAVDGYASILFILALWAVLRYLFRCETMAFAGHNRAGRAVPSNGLPR